MKNRITLIVIFIVFFNLIASSTPPAENGWVVDKIVPSEKIDDPEEAKFYPSNIKLKNGKLIETNIYELQYIGMLSGEKNFLILSGRECYECDAPFELFIHPLNTIKLDVQESLRHDHPGKHYCEGDLVYEARAFFGDCLSTKGKEIVWFETRHERKIILNSVYILKINKTGELTQEEIKEKLPNLNQTLEKVKKGICKEIKGFEYHSQ